MLKSATDLTSSQMEELCKCSYCEYGEPLEAIPEEALGDSSLSESQEYSAMARSFGVLLDDPILGFPGG